MYKIYIDNFLLEESDIEGFDSFNIEKSLSKVYWGYWNADGFGFSDSNSSARLTIRNLEIASYIKQIFARDKFSAEILVTILNEGSGQRVQMLIDFSDYSEIDCCFIAISFRPIGGGDLIKAREKVEYPIRVDTEIQVPIRNFPEAVNFKVNSQAYISNSSQSQNHSIPLVPTEDSFSIGAGHTVAITSTNPFLTATSCVNVVGSIKLGCSATTEGYFIVKLLTDTDEYIIDHFPIGVNYVEQTISISQQIELDGDLRLVIEGEIGASQFVYDDSSSGLSVEKCVTTAIDWRTIRAVSLRDVFSSIISQATNQSSTLNKYEFDNEFFDHYLTNNEGLQNKITTINLDLSKTFEELNNKYPSSIDVNNNLVDVLARQTFLTTGEPYNIAINDLSREINSELLYSNVKVGYNNWKGEKPQSNLEHNSTREFQSDYVISSNSLSILNDWSASNSLISEQIQDKKEKEEIHWIVVNKATLKAETNQKIEANIYQADRAINLRISPTRNMNRWRKFLLSDFEFVSGSGNYNFESTDTLEGNTVDETQNIISESILEPYIYFGTVNSCDVSIDRLRGLVTFEYCGETKLGFVSSVKYTISQSSEETIELEILGLVQ